MSLSFSKVYVMWTNDSAFPVEVAFGLLLGTHLWKKQLRLTMACAQQTWPLALGEKVFLIHQKNDFSVFSAASQCDPARVPHPSAWYVVLGVLPRFYFSISQREIAKQHSFM